VDDRLSEIRERIKRYREPWPKGDLGWVDDAEYLLSELALRDKMLEVAEKALDNARYHSMSCIDMGCSHEIARCICHYKIMVEALSTLRSMREEKC
jgi:hypothetical protein